MEEALVGAVVGATIQIVLQNLLSVSIDEIKRVYGFKKDLSKLKESLELIQDFLHDAETKQVSDRAVKRWLGRLEDVAFKADAVLHEFNYDLLRIKVKKQNGETSKVTSFIPRVSCKLLFTIKVASRIKDVNDELERINKEASNFGLQAAVTGAAHSRNIAGLNTLYIDSPQTNSFSAEPNIIGRDDEVLNIVDMLVTAPQDRTISVIPIVGMGGLGKTTLARKVYNHERIEAHFPKKIWVCVSVSLDAMALFKKILEILTGASVQGMETEEAVLDNMKKNLEGKKYLLVLDDFWNENSTESDSFLSSLSGISPVKGSCIVLTTRSVIVASNLQTLSTPQLRKLSGDECWSIIKSKAFHGVVRTVFEEVGTRIAQRCGGLPLAAKVVGGLLRGKSKDEWESILTNQLSKDDTVTKILKLSYNRLPSCVHKKCFAYCSIFPQDFRINRKELIELWMAEGFLQVDGGKDMETVGDAIFNHLTENSLFQDETWDKFGNILHCKMHDLVHDLACSIAEGTHRVRYHTVKDERDAISQDQMNYLRTLFVSGKTLPNLFPGFKCLYVLNLSGTEMEELPKVIGNLIHLRFLNITDTEIKRIPDSIGKLYNLQSLWICYYSWESISLKILPNSIINMISLRHLHIPASLELPPGIGKLTSLRTLPYYKVGHEKGRSIKELGKLKNLQGEVEIQNLERVKDKEEAEESWLSKKSKIFRLVFEWNASQDERNDKNVLDGLQPNPSLKFLEIIGYSGSSFPRWTMNMEVHNHIQGSWELLQNLIDIKLQNCKQCEQVPMLGHLPSLKFLRLDRLSNLQSIGHSFYGIRNVNTSSMNGDAKLAEPIISFPALERLELSEMAELSEWAEVEAGITVFPCLKYLKIAKCPKLNSLLSRFPYLENLSIYGCPKLKTVQCHLPCLEKLKVNGVSSEFYLADVCSSTSCLKLIRISNLAGLTCFPVEIFVKDENVRKLSPASSSVGGRGGSSSLEELHIESCPELESIPPVTGLTSLRELHIRLCEKLRELPPDLNTLQSLEVLEIFSCPEVKSIPYVSVGGGDYSQQPGLTSSLRHLTIINCSGLIELPVEVFESCSSSLQKLTLRDLENLENLGTVPSLSRMSSLRELNLVKIPKLRNFPITDISCLSRSLVSLSIGGFSDSMSFDSFNQLLSQLLPNLHSLERLSLYGKEDWDCVPDQIRHLTALTTLGLHYFEIIEVLPEWIGNLSSLEELWISNCKRLRHFPSKEVMQSLTKLDWLYMHNCPLLEERYRDEQTTTSTTTSAVDASEWSKISHIKYIDIYCTEYAMRMKVTFLFFFSSTTPFGIDWSNAYSEHSPTALIVERMIF